MTTKTHVTTKPKYLRGQLRRGCAQDGRRRIARVGDLREDETRLVNDLAAKSILSDMTAEAKTVGPDSVREAVKVIAAYYRGVNSLDVPRDLRELLGKTFEDVVREASK